MTGTANDNFTYIAESQAGKATQANAAFDAIDARLDSTLAVDLSAGDGAASLAQLQRAWAIAANGAAVARTLTLDPFVGGRWIANNGTAVVTVAIGSTSMALPPGEAALYEGDGTTNGLALLIGPLAPGAATETTLAGTTAGTVKWTMPNQGAYSKKFVAWLTGYENTSGTPQTISFPTAFRQTPVFTANTDPEASASTTTLTLPDNMTGTLTGI